ncbi:MAG TPA: radical SAM protein [Candidatus Krumholzibacteria bacterium]|nr:radical SAM protein [Candidatus Krumholzibacteria bacterium]
MNDGWQFEPGHEPVVAIGSSNKVQFELGSRPQVLRLELPRDHAIHFDDAGRIISVQKDGVSYRRTLDSRLLVSKIVRVPHRARQHLDPPADCLRFLARQHAHASEALRLLQNEDSQQNCEVLRGKLVHPARWAREALTAASRFDLNALKADREAVRQVYLPIPILPPDHYSSLVLQLTEGCAWNRCSFCNFYKQIQYRERSFEEFARHFDQVLAYLGPSLNRYHRIFLGQANALMVENRRLLPKLQAVTERIPLLDPSMSAATRAELKASHQAWFEGFYSFIDGFHPRKSEREFAQLAEAGVRRVYLGLESGDDEILRLLGKPPASEAAIELVKSLHGASIRVGVIVLVGAGKKKYFESHLASTLRVLERMELCAGDQLYLSKLVVHDEEPYARRAEAEGLGALSELEQDRQLAEFREGVRSGLSERIPIAPYDIDLTRTHLPSSPS